MNSPTLTHSCAFDLEPLSADTRSGEPLEYLDLLGVGGMGIVHEAQQLSVDRPVAVKTLRDGRCTEAQVEQLVREARTLGLLEHPNILPIYTLTSSGESPALVCKKIQGEEWSAYLRTPGLAEEVLGVEDVLEWHLGVLLKVIDAIRFAHSRGVLHRDLKPSNVMIGEFGEVYLMDWGLAVSTRPEHEGTLQLATDIVRVSGTFCYLAPEMLEPERLGITEQTDVYQLGGMLYEICMGRPPHDGHDREELETNVRISWPPMRESVPTELVAICRRAMRARAAERFASADELRRAVKQYLRHRGAGRLAEKGEGLLAELAEKLVQPLADRTSLYRLVAPCRFAFQQALEIWDDNERAQRGRVKCERLAAEYELAAGEPAQALALLDGHQEDDLSERCQRALAAKTAEERAAEALRLRNCREFNSASRRAAIAGIAAGWALLPVGLKLGLVSSTYVSQTSSQVGFLALWLFIGFLGRRWIGSTEINVRSYDMVLAATILALVVKAGSFSMGASAETAQVYDLFVFFTAGLLTTMFIDWRMWPTAVAYLGAFMVSAIDPSICLWAMGASNAVLAATAAWIWRDCAS